MTKQKYIFNHFPKTAGTSLVSICRANLGDAAVSPPLLEDDIRIQPERFEHYQFINGHFFIFTQTAFSSDRYSMIVLRDPVRRIVSSYAFWRKVPVRNFLTAAAKDLSFTDFVHYFRKSPLITNNYAHFLAMIARDCPAYPPDDAALLASAKRNLSAYDFVGITEEFERTTRLLCHQLCWPSPAFIPHENSSGSEALLDHIPTLTLQLLHECNQLDLEIYRHARSLFHARESSEFAGATNRSSGQRRFTPLILTPVTNRRVIVDTVTATWEPEGSRCTLNLVVCFRAIRPIAEPCLEVQIHDDCGRLIWCANTTSDLLDLGTDLEGDYCADFLLEGPLRAGVYSVTVGLFDSRRYGFHEHWLDQLVKFHVESGASAENLADRELRLKAFHSVRG